MQPFLATRGHDLEWTAIGPMVFLVLLFPDGRLPSRRWRPVPWAMLAVGAGWTAQQFQAGTTITGALEAAGVSYSNPLEYLPWHGWFSSLLAGLAIPGLATAALVVVSVFARRRGASTELRKQLAWLDTSARSRSSSSTACSRTATCPPWRACCSGRSCC